MSANTPLPVPSKAALRALRGIVLGTSCTLALITEDRRRRINMARSAIHNGNCIRSARRYHSDSNALADALEEEGSLTVENGVVHWKAADTNAQRLSRQERLLLAASTPSAEEKDKPGPVEQPHTQQLDSRHIQQPLPSLVQQADGYKSRIRPMLRPQNAVPNGTAAAAVGLADLPVVTAQLVELIAADSPARLEAAVKVLLSTECLFSSSSEDALSIPADQLQALRDASSALCRGCQEAGRMDLAQEVLRLAVQNLQLDEEAYFAHNPLPVVASLIPSNELMAAREKSEDTEADNDALDDTAVRQLRKAIWLFLPHLVGSRSRSATEFVPLARQLLERAFAVGKRRLIKSVYAAIVAYDGEMSGLMLWYIKRLHETERYKLIVWAYLAKPKAAVKLPTSGFLELGDRVVDAVRLTNTAKAGEILRFLSTVRSSDRQMRTSWVTELLHCQWRKGQDYEAVQQRFTALVTSKGGGLAARVHYPDGVYRVMVQIALEAGRTDEAEDFLATLRATNAAMADDIRVQGLFALQQAKQGDWEGVRARFGMAVTAAMSSGGRGLVAEDTERVFVPIVKEYTRTHTIGETEDFLKSYIDGLGIPPGRRLVTLLAHEYGALREVQSFVGWLEYCAQAGFEVDAAFSNAILNSCRKHWKFGFRDLRTMYRKLCVLSPNFEDRVTQTIMTHAAISDARYMGRPVKGRILSLRTGGKRIVGSTVTPIGNVGTVGTISTVSTASTASTASFVSPLSMSGRFLDEESLFLSMKHAFATGMVSKAVRLYRRATHSGVQASERCLKLAVAAATRQASGRGSFDTAIELLRTAQLGGQDIDGAAAYVAVACIDVEGPAASARRGRNGAAAAVQSILAQLEASDVRVSDLALNRAAFCVFKAGHMRGAVALALSAANTPVAGGRPGYNVWNFAVLIAAYARLADAEGLRMTVDAATAAVLAERLAYNALKQARRRLRLMGGTAHVPPVDDMDESRDFYDPHSNSSRALLAVELGLDHARRVRRRLSSQRVQVEAATIDIMRRAALDAGCAPVDFDDVPFLHRRPSADSADAPQHPVVHHHTDSLDSLDLDGWELPDVPAAAAVATGPPLAAPLVACPT
ncbi:hypothetical protein CMQ_2862 [Grosmannia clavigera kw1407]|uniref:Pentatricopeptide repeat protein n=1 Tax=Grosmannia clavigera (strain kw1407 / UAMH 11150) TaxID=655863 RepID=F0XHX4_GROCL|nr:uncharacterized protein CMQ_2862 [Grosmannia clavigera kw1407]EFX02933.1 hypothetical protein CMQ_2862 [Grosmannia clavigera kw1407]